MKRRIILNLVGRGFGLTAKELAEITECSVGHVNNVLREYRSTHRDARLVLRTEPRGNALGY